ncbi:AbrB/MazE/SpoVT family DNA-binding domain-containing protein [Parvibaculum sp.]|uniref:AbrB/MazE/SpoVT family DNA-binding domain-containing protein n=1 Tax=Parvibaculum sp. TaxID=2024848 RepID=UPI00351F0D3A
MKTESLVTTKGRITIPLEIREYLRLRSGDRVTFFIRSDGNVALRRKSLPETTRQVDKDNRNE